MIIDVFLQLVEEPRATYGLVCKYLPFGAAVCNIYLLNGYYNNKNNKSDELRDPPSYLDEVKIGRGWVQN